MPLTTIDGDAIRIGRTFRHMSQRQLGQATGLPVWRIWKLENNVCRPSQDEIAVILEALSTGGA
jgi:hypothetical protein